MAANMAVTIASKAYQNNLQDGLKERCITESTRFVSACYGQHTSNDMYVK